MWNDFYVFPQYFVQEVGGWVSRFLQRHVWNLPALPKPLFIRTIKCDGLFFLYAGMLFTFIPSLRTKDGSATPFQLRKKVLQFPLSVVHFVCGHFQHVQFFIMFLFICDVYVTNAFRTSVYGTFICELPTMGSCAVSSLLPFMALLLTLMVLFMWKEIRDFSPNVVITLYFLNLKMRVPECRLNVICGPLKVFILKCEHCKI